MFNKKRQERKANMDLCLPSSVGAVIVHVLKYRLSLLVQVAIHKEKKLIGVEV